MLLAIVDLLHEEHWPTIALDVETMNANALRLYKSCGFRTNSCTGYLDYPFENEQVKSCLDILARDEGIEEKIV